MRTSRLAQDSAKLAQILPPRSTRHSTRFALAASIDGGPAANAFDGSNDANPPPSPVHSSASTPALMSPRKRKRSTESSDTTQTLKVVARTRVSPRRKGVKLEQEEGISLDVEDAIPNAHPRRAKRQPAKRIVDSATGVTYVQGPPPWKEQYAAIQEMRRRHVAPVDTMGCERQAELERPPIVQRFQHLVALMLSSQTKDTTTAVAMNRLRTELPPPGLTLEGIRQVEPARLNELIRLVGFHNNKTRFLKRTADILVDQYNGDIPDTAAKIMELPGVGPKMAHLCMSAAWGRTEGIGVDVHVHRISNLLGWHATRTPEETRGWLEGWLPREKWHEVNGLLVGFGQTICLPVGRRCGECTLSVQGLCPSAVVERRKKVKRVKKEKEVVEDGDVVKTEDVEVSVKEEEKTIEDSI